MSQAPQAMSQAPQAMSKAAHAETGRRDHCDHHGAAASVPKPATWADVASPKQLHPDQNETRWSASPMCT